MKSVFTLAFLFLYAHATWGQAQAGYVENKKVQLSAAVLEVPYEEDIVKDALDNHLNKKSKSATDIKGFTSFRNNQGRDDGSMASDLYFKVERKSRKEKNSTIISLLVGKPDPGLAEDQKVYLEMEEAKSILNSLVPVIDAYALEVQIKEQNDVVKKAESKHASLIKEGEDLERKKADIEKKIIENTNRIQAQQAEIENQKQKLTEMVSRRSA